MKIRFELPKYLLFTAVAFLFVGCASTHQIHPFPDQAKELENPKYSRIYLLRPTIFGAAIPMDVFENDSRIGTTGPRGYLCWEREPSEIRLKGKGENESSITLYLKEGQVYYVQQHISMGFLYARNWLEQLSDQEGKKKLAKCKPPKVKSSSTEPTKPVQSEAVKVAALPAIPSPVL